jgi:hypothetical protein
VPVVQRRALCDKDGDDMGTARFIIANTWSRLRLIGMFMLIAASPAFAASGDTPRQPLAGGGLLVTLAIVYLSRRRAIGGWLLYFYVQLYLSLAVSMIFIPQVISNLNPRQWDNSFLYVMFFLSVVPVLLVEVIEVIVATRLLFRRNENSVRVLRNTLVALVITSAAAIAIDLGYFRDASLFFDVLTLAFAIIWTLYFSRSKRVRSVFIDNKWTYDPASRKRILTAQDKSRLRKRTLIAALVTFVAFLLLMGSVLKEEAKQPDIGIFAVPAFYALVAAIIAWYLPIRKKKTGSDEKLMTDEEKSDT